MSDTNSYRVWGIIWPKKAQIITTHRLRNPDIGRAIKGWLSVERLAAQSYTFLARFGQDIQQNKM